MRVASGVLLRLEERVEVPEAALHVVVGRHLTETNKKNTYTNLQSSLQVYQMCFIHRVSSINRRLNAKKHFGGHVDAGHKVLFNYPISKKICLNCERTLSRG